MGEQHPARRGLRVPQAGHEPEGTALSDHVDSRAERLAAALDDFIRSSPDVEAAAVVSFDGLPMASALPDDLEEDRVGAMSAALLSLGEQAALGLGRGQLNQVFVEGEHGFVFLMSARDQAVLAAIAARTAKIGFMLFEMRRAADRIGRALESPLDARTAPPTVAPPVAPPAPAAEHAPADHHAPAEDHLPTEHHAPAAEHHAVDDHGPEHAPVDHHEPIFEHHASAEHHAPAAEHHVPEEHLIAAEPAPWEQPSHDPRELVHETAPHDAGAFRDAFADASSSPSDHWNV
jgi:uncharacterized protein